LVVLRTRDELATSRIQWDALAGNHPFFCWEWTYAWWQVYGPTRQAAVLVALDERNRWVGLFPLCLERRRYWGRVLTNMSSGRACADHVRPIIVPGLERDVTGLMADWIRQQAEDRTVDLVEWDGVDSGSPVVVQLASVLESHGWSLRTQELESAWITELPASWQPFEKSIKKCFRRKIQKAHRNMLLPGVEIQFLEDPGQIQQRWSDVERLHQARRESRSQAGCFAEEGMSAFLQNAMMRLAENRKAFVLLASQDGQPFGMCVVLRQPDCWFMYQTGFDPELARLEPGHLLMTCAVRRAVEQGCPNFDFLRGDEPYKARWNTVRSPLARVRLIPNRWGPQARMRMFEWTRWIRSAVRTRLFPSQTQRAIALTESE
jgi:CelD/BcsL family acetyltransferase involved in cellulose biosynthesis